MHKICFNLLFCIGCNMVFLLAILKNTRTKKKNRLQISNGATFYSAQKIKSLRFGFYLPKIFSRKKVNFRCTRPNIANAPYLGQLLTFNFHYHY